MKGDRRAFGLAGVLVLLAALHAFWALGGEWGLAAALGGPGAPIPPVWSIWLVVGLLVVAALVPLGRAGVWGRALPPWIFAVGCWGLAVVMVLVAVVNAGGQTWLERLGFAPFALLLAVLAATVARAPRRTKGGEGA